MEYAYAALMLNETGEEINETNLKAVLSAAGADVIESRVKALVAALEGVDLDQVAQTDSADVAGEPTNGRDGSSPGLATVSDRGSGTETAADADDTPSATQRVVDLFGGDDAADTSPTAEIDSDSNAGSTGDDSDSNDGATGDDSDSNDGASGDGSGGRSDVTEGS